MAAIMEKHLETRTVLVGKNVSVAEFIAAYTLDMTSMLRLLECLPSLHLYLERRYARPRGGTQDPEEPRASSKHSQPPMKMSTMQPHPIDDVKNGLGEDFTGESFNNYRKCISDILDRLAPNK